jgi:single-strand DNA-binding protein
MSTSITGNVVENPELRFTSGGTAKASFSVAVTRRRKRAQEWVEETSFFDVVCWRELAENVAESVSRGTRVVVAGRLEQRTYTAKDGNERSVVEIVADEVAPSLRWATCSVTRNERRNSQGDGGRQPTPARSADRGHDDFGEEPW